MKVAEKIINTLLASGIATAGVCLFVRGYNRTAGPMVDRMQNRFSSAVSSIFRRKKKDAPKRKYTRRANTSPTPQPPAEPMRRRGIGHDIG